MATLSETLALARQRHRAGDVNAAAQLYRQVVQAEPDHAEALALLGLALDQAGDSATAEGFYRRALALRPDEPQVHFNFGNALLSQGRRDEAADHFRHAVRLEPEFVEAWNHLGNVLFLQDRPAEAIPCYERAVRLRPDFAEACRNLGKALREVDRLTEGMAWYRQAVRLRPTHAKAHNDLAVALLELGEIPEAESHFRHALRCDPGAIQVLWNLAAYGLYSEQDPNSDQLRAWLRDGQLSSMEASQLHFILGYLLDRAGDYDDAFAHFDAGNRLRREQFQQADSAFDPAAHARFIDQLIEVFTPAYFEHVRRVGLETEVPVFIVGMPRSGTSLVEQILTHHPEVAGAGELRDIPRLVNALADRRGTEEQYPECMPGIDAATSQQLAAPYLERLRQLGGSARRVTDKNPENFLHLGLIATLFPQARVIHCRRDPLDTCLSCYLRFFQGMSFACDLGDLGRYYREYERLMAHWQAALPLDMLELVYEDLVADPEGESRRLVAFCGLDWDERCLRFHENARAVRTPSKLQVRRPIYPSAVGRWRHYAAHLGPLQEALGFRG